MRLIDVDKFKKFISELPKGENGYSQVYDKSSILDFIDDQPAAYDVDKVIERLEHDTEIALKRYMTCNADTLPVTYTRYSTQYKERRKCLEIFKSGGTT